MNVDSPTVTGAAAAIAAAVKLFDWRSVCLTKQVDDWLQQLHQLETRLFYICRWRMQPNAKKEKNKKSWIINNLFWWNAND